MTDGFDVVIVGAGHAGAQAAIALRQRGFTGSVGIISDEAEYPYERPPLSKEYLAGDRPFERILLRPPTFWEKRSVQVLNGHAVERIDAAAHVVTLSDGQSIGYGTLIWAAGGAARRLGCDGHDLAGVHTIRTRADVDRLVQELPHTRRVVVVGGGYIGLEAASVLRKLGKEVVLLEALDRVLARVAGETLSRFYEAEHRAHGVDLRLNTAVDRIEGADGRVRAVHLADGDEIACDMVVVGIGIVPNVAPLAEAGAQMAGGVLVDASCRTSLPDILAIGDCAAHANAYADGATIRVESVQNANDQAAVAAQIVTGAQASYAAVPWFWSNQYDLRLQTIGLSIGHDRTVVRGDPAARSFSVVYLRAGRVVALDCVNATKDYVDGRVLVEAGAAPAASLLTDASIPLRKLSRPG